MGQKYRVALKVVSMRQCHCTQPCWHTVVLRGAQGGQGKQQHKAVLAYCVMLGQKYRVVLKVGKVSSSSSYCRTEWTQQSL